jgi:hypothetical protein
MVVWFSNPIEPSFMSAKANVSIRGSATVDIDDQLKFIFKLSVDQTLVTSLKPFFFTETTRSEFEKEFKRKLTGKILNSINATLATGVRLPLGTSFQPTIKDRKVEIHSEFILIEAQLDDSHVNAQPKIKKINLHDSSKM